MAPDLGILNTWVAESVCDKMKPFCPLSLVLYNSSLHYIALFSGFICYSIALFLGFMLYAKG